MPGNIESLISISWNESMDEEIRAKRDSRRKRILENSEKRLSKIIDRENGGEFQARGARLDSSNQTFGVTSLRSETVRPYVNGQLSNCTLYDNDEITRSMDRLTDAISELRDVDCTSARIERTSSGLLANRTNYIFLAVIVNILVIFQLDHLFGKAVALPYFPILLGRLYNYKSAREMQGNDLFYAALILCNIKPKLTYQFKKFITLIYMTLGDLALYIFSFTVIRYGLLCYSRDTNTVVALDS